MPRLKSGPFEAFLYRMRARIGRHGEVGGQFLRFLVVGVGAFVVYVSAQALSIEWGGVAVMPATIVAFASGTVFSYLGNALWSFQQKPTLRSISVFLVVTLLGLLLNVAIAAAFERLHIHYLAIAVVVFTVVPLFNFIGHRLFSFRTSETT